MNFADVWARIKKETHIKNLTQLAEIVGKTQQAVSAVKGKGKEFPVEWAYIVGKKYDISLDWLLTGEEPVRAGTAKEPKSSFVLLIDEWLYEMKREDPGREEWFRCNFEDCFPSFKSWAQRKKAANQHRRLAETMA